MNAKSKEGLVSEQHWWFAWLFLFIPLSVIEAKYSGIYTTAAISLTCPGTYFISLCLIKLNREKFLFYFEELFFALLFYAALASIETIVIHGDILEYAVLVNGFLSAHAWPILLWIGFIAYFYPKLGWKTIGVFFLANGLDGLGFEFTYNFLYEFLFRRLPANAVLHPDAGSAADHYFQIATEVIQIGLALWILKPWKSFSPKWYSWLALAIWLWTYILAFSNGYKITIYPEFQYNVIANLGDVLGLFFLPLFCFTAFNIRGKSPLIERLRLRKSVNKQTKNVANT